MMKKISQLKIKYSNEEVYRISFDGVIVKLVITPPKFGNSATSLEKK